MSRSLYRKDSSLDAQHLPQVLKSQRGSGRTRPIVTMSSILGEPVHDIEEEEQEEEEEEIAEQEEGEFTDRDKDLVQLQQHNEICHAVLSSNNNSNNGLVISGTKQSDEDKYLNHSSHSSKFVQSYNEHVNNNPPEHLMPEINRTRSASTHFMTSAIKKRGSSYHTPIGRKISSRKKERAKSLSQFGDKHVSFLQVEDAGENKLRHSYKSVNVLVESECIDINTSEEASDESVGNTHDICTNTSNDKLEQLPRTLYSRDSYTPLVPIIGDDNEIVNHPSFTDGLLPVPAVSADTDIKKEIDSIPELTDVDRNIYHDSSTHRFDSGKYSSKTKLQSVSVNSSRVYDTGVCESTLTDIYTSVNTKNKEDSSSVGIASISEIGKEDHRMQEFVSRTSSTKEVKNDSREKSGDAVDGVTSTKGSEYREETTRYDLNIEDQNSPSSHILLSIDKTRKILDSTSEKLTSNERGNIINFLKNQNDILKKDLDKHKDLLIKVASAIKLHEREAAVSRLRLTDSENTIQDLKKETGAYYQHWNVEKRELESKLSSIQTEAIERESEMESEAIQLRQSLSNQIHLLKQREKDHYRTLNDLRASQMMTQKQQEDVILQLKQSKSCNEDMSQVRRSYYPFMIFISPTRFKREFLFLL